MVADDDQLTRSEPRETRCGLVEDQPVARVDREEVVAFDIRMPPQRVEVEGQTGRRHVLTLERGLRARGDRRQHPGQDRRENRADDRNADDGGQHREGDVPPDRSETRPGAALHDN